jgi:hypothetical protein
MDASERGRCEKPAAPVAWGSERGGGGCGAEGRSESFQGSHVRAVAPQRSFGPSGLSLAKNPEGVPALSEGGEVGQAPIALNCPRCLLTLSIIEIVRLVPGLARVDIECLGSRRCRVVRCTARETHVNS